MDVNTQFQLRPWQAEELSYQDAKSIIQASPRTGKTLVGVLWAARLEYNYALVVAPKTVCPDWANLLWAQGFEVVRLYQYTPKVFTLACSPGKTPLQAFCKTVYVINYDKVGNLPPTFKPELLVCDESHYIKSPSSQRGKKVRRLAKTAKYVRLLTGTLAPNNVGDTWGQGACVSEEFDTSFTKFAKKWLIQDFMMYGKILGVRNPKQFQAMLDRCSRSYRREDVFGPDTWVETVRTFDLPERARKHYDVIVKDWILKADDEGLDLTLTHALSRMLRLQQLTSGYLPGEGGPRLVHSEKIDLVMGDLADIIEAGEKAVLFHQFTWEGLQYEERARKAGYTVYAINGSVSIEERERAIREFRSAETAVFVIQTQAGGIGIDLATAKHALFVSQSYSFAAETQARDRIYSPGQVRTATYYRATRSIDQYIAHIIETKQSVHDAVRSSRIQDIANYEIVRTKGRLF